MEADDAWKDNYDQWKLAIPDEGRTEDECDHENYEADILSGRAYCDRCGYGWLMTPEQWEIEHRRHVEYDRWAKAHERRERWLRFTAPFRWLWYRLWMPISPRTAVKSLDDDEIPF